MSCKIPVNRTNSEDREIHFRGALRWNGVPRLSPSAAPFSRWAILIGDVSCCNSNVVCRPSPPPRRVDYLPFRWRTSFIWLVATLALHGRNIDQSVQWEGNWLIEFKWSSQWLLSKVMIIKRSKSKQRLAMIQQRATRHSQSVFQSQRHFVHNMTRITMDVVIVVVVDAEGMEIGQTTFIHYANSIFGYDVSGLS